MRINSVSRIPNCVTPYTSIVVIDEASTHNWTLELSVKSLEVTDVPLYQRLLTGRSEVVPYGIWSGRSAVTERIDVSASCGVVPSDLVGDGVDDFEIVCKCAGSDLVIVSRVAPSTEPTFRAIAENGSVGEIGASVCEVGRVSITTKDWRYRRRVNRPNVQSQYGWVP